MIPGVGSGARVGVCFGEPSVSAGVNQLWSHNKRDVEGGSKGRSTSSSEIVCLKPSNFQQGCNVVVFFFMSQCMRVGRATAPCLPEPSGGVTEFIHALHSCIPAPRLALSHNADFRGCNA